MNYVYIVDTYNNPSLLRLTQAKVWYNYENKSTRWVKDCFTIKHIDEVKHKDAVIINSGDYAPIGIREDYINVTGIHDLRALPGMIRFNPDHEYNTNKHPPYKRGDKQLYIIENLYKSVIQSRNLIYLENTDNILCQTDHKNFYSPASGFRGVEFLIANDIDQFDNIIIYDRCKRQLDFAKWLHAQSVLPDSVNIELPYYGKYAPSKAVRDFWPRYHKKNIQFLELNLFDKPTFLKDSFINASNIFTYEPNIFVHGWDKCKQSRSELVINNSTSTIKTTLSYLNS